MREAAHNSKGCDRSNKLITATTLMSFVPRRWWLVLLLCLLALVLAHGMALLYRIGPAVSLWFPPSGVAIALTLWFGPIGVVLTGVASILVAPQWGNDGWTRIVALTDATEPLVAWFLYRHCFSGSLLPNRLRDAAAFTLSAPLAACAASALTGSLALVAVGKMPASNLADSIPHWWLGNAIGTLALAPTALLVLTPFLQRWGWLPPANQPNELSAFAHAPSRRLIAEIVGILVLIVSTAALTVSETHSAGFAFQQLSFLSFVPIIWAATRFGVLGGMLTSSFCVLVTLLAYLVAYPNAISLPSFPVPAEVLHVHKLSLLMQCAVSLFVGCAITERAATQVALAVERVRAMEHQTRAQLSEQLMQLNEQLRAANSRLQESNRDKDELLLREQIARADSEAARSAAESARKQVSQILESITDGFIVFDPEWRFTYLNHEAAHILGRCIEELLGKNLWEELPELGGTSFGQLYQQAVIEGVPLELEDYYPPFDMWFVARAYPSESGLSIYFRNITKRKQAEQELLQAQERLRVAIKNSPITVFNHDRELRYTWLYNPVFDYSVNVVVGKRDEDLIPSDDAEILTQIKRRVLETGVGTREEVKITMQGQDWYYDLTVEPLLDATGAVIGVTGAAVDITDRKRTEEALRASEAFYRTLGEAVPDFVWSCDAEGRVDYVNPRWVEYTGVTLKQLNEGGLEQVNYPGDFPSLIKQWNLAKQKGESFEAEFRYKRKDGAYRWFMDRAVPLKDGAGNIVKWIGTTTDIHERKQAEEERNQLLGREQAARAEAEAANRIKDEFLAVLSHELRTPLNPILGWSKLLQSRKLDEATTARALETIERNAQLQTQLIEDLLDVSRILQGKLSLNVCAVDLAPTIEAALETVRLSAQAKMIQIQTQLESTVGQVLGDSNRLQQVFWNLLSNAIKFTPAGGRVDVRLSVVFDRTSYASNELGHPASVSRQWSSTALPMPQMNRGIHPRSGDSGQSQPITDNYAQLQVSDTGCGINPDFLPFVFDYFRQENSTTTRSFGGLGLGLAIVRHLVELHGGCVKVTSPGEGLGSTFTVTLPLMNLKPQTIEDKGGLDRSPNLKGIRLLIVDDEVDTLKLLVFILEEYGAQVRAVTSATEALEVFAQWQPDLLLSDIGMPEVDGYMLIRQIRSLPPEQGGQIHAIALTAYAGETDQQQILEAGFQKHVTKPVDPVELAAVIADLVNR
ncbi:MAG TPA: PAS domain S-box protein [Coleofasciculaceae cyanobacterium]